MGVVLAWHCESTRTTFVGTVGCMGLSLSMSYIVWHNTCVFFVAACQCGGWCEDDSNPPEGSNGCDKRSAYCISV